MRVSRSIEEQLMDEMCGGRVEGPGRFIRKEEDRLFCQLPGKDHPLLLPS